MSSSQTQKSSFIRVPKTLLQYITLHKLTPEAVLLYALMLDRSSLSKRNGADWVDDQGRTFINFTASTIQCLLSCGHDKATRLVRELESVGLITISSQAPGKPRRIIVHPVAGFNSDPVRQTSTDPPCFSAGNNTYLSYTDDINTDSSTMLIGSDITFQIKDNIEYRALLQRYSAEDIESIIRLMVDTLQPPTQSITISGVQRSYQSVYSRFLEIGQMEMAYVLDRLQNDAVNIKCMRAYILSLLFEAPTLSNFYYSTKQNYDEARR